MDHPLIRGLIEADMRPEESQDDVQVVGPTLPSGEDDVGQKWKNLEISLIPQLSPWERSAKLLKKLGGVQ